jgi:ABC-type multidrug transport system fused ATPase/permease subunit
LMLLVPMRQLGMTLGLAQRATASGARLFEIFDRGPRIAAPADAKPLPEGNGHVVFDEVTFTYANAPSPALRDVSLDVPAGTTVALVGATGSGKTTLVQLLGRLYDVDSGSVSIDGADVRTVDPVELHHAIATVDDSPFLFSSTVADNIAYARGGADAVDRAEIERAAQRAQAHDFIMALPDGYDTRVGERGLTLSGGQRQRVAIARALLADPRILVLDDATSAVDASTEQHIKDALREVMAGRTTFVIAHRLSTISLADTIVVLEDGAVAAAGGHDALLEQSELYREIVEKGLPDQVFLTRKEQERQVAGL